MAHRHMFPPNDRVTGLRVEVSEDLRSMGGTYNVEVRLQHSSVGWRTHWRKAWNGAEVECIPRFLQEVAWAFLYEEERAVTRAAAKAYKAALDHRRKVERTG